MINVILCVAIVYLLLCASIFFYQDQLIFPRVRGNPELYARYADSQVSLQQKDIVLQGWKLQDAPSENTDAGSITIYFGGNGEDVISMLPFLQKLGSETIYTFNYRGYGYSQGKPSQATLYADALAIYDDIAARHRKNPNRKIIVIGRSLGTAIAGYLATQRKLDGLILITPLKSAIENGKRKFPFLPVKYLIRHPLDLKTLAKDFTCPVLLLIAEADTVIPPADSQQTYDAVTSPKRLVKLQDVGHGNVFDNPNALNAMRQFLTR